PALAGDIAGAGAVDEGGAARGLVVVRDAGAIEKAVDEALAANPDIVEKYRAGNKKVTGAIVGAVMKATQGKADPGQVNQLIAKKLAE
ncbi:GatB/YqeY domain-containing protein, partial [Staphylococcus aureus]|nr:GatB/YqeY domain-containing protein [Staphylococcus aureus]